MITEKLRPTESLGFYTPAPNIPATSVYYSIDSGNTVDALSQPTQADDNPLNNSGCGCPSCCKLKTI